MLSWLFKKRGAPAAAPAAPTPAARPAAKPGPKQAPAPVPAIDWAAQLAAAQGDDTALLHLAQSAAPLAVKLGAVEALAGEDALRQAEREFRTHDRKVHRLAKQRLEAAVAQREARAQAQGLLAQAQTLVDDPQLPVNRVATLDRDWAALPAALLQPEQQAAFDALRARLGVLLRAQADALQVLQRWTAEAQRCLQQGPAELRAVAEHGSRADVAAWSAPLLALRQSRPESPTTAGPDAALALALQTADWLQAQLAQLEAPRVDAAGAAGEPAADAPVAEAPSGPEMETPLQPSADALAQPEAATPMQPDAAIPTQPEAALAEPPGLDPALARVLQQRLDARTRARPPAAPAVDAASATGAAPGAAKAHPKPRNRPEPVAATPEQCQHVEALLLQAEAALADGQLGRLQQHLQSLDPLLSQKLTTWPEALRARQQALWAERGRLKDWQQWGGARARDDLVAEAQALAGQISPAVAADGAADDAVEGAVEGAVEEAAKAEAVEAAPVAQPDPVAEPVDAVPEAASDAVAAPAEHPQRPAVPTAGPRRPPAPRPAPKLNLKALADSIQSLRQRWKDIDRQGTAASAEQWQAFDAALHTAHGPLAAQHAALQAARRENQAAREALLASLEAQAEAVDGRESQRLLAGFQAAWRKLGPIEHTAPAASREALQQRLQQALARIEEPLRTLQDAAVAQRERLIARAQACLPAGGERPHADAARQVRELQAEWQEHARGLPLPRGIENALWARFKAATDAVFVQREAAFAARDAELAANLQAAEVLVQRLVAAGTELPLADIERTLTEVDRAWRQGGELPRGTVDALEARYRAARAAAVQRQGEGQRLEWQAQCDALAARLRLCEQREDTGTTAEPAADLPRLPKAWEQPLAQRGARPVSAGPGPLPPAQVDEWLLRLETALNLPTAPEWQAARQQLKLRALKDALEGRAAPAQAQPVEALRAALQQSGLSPAQRTRLQALVAALRAATPGTLAR